MGQILVTIAAFACVALIGGGVGVLLRDQRRLARDTSIALSKTRQDIASVAEDIYRARTAINYVDTRVAAIPGLLNVAAAGIVAQIASSACDLAARQDVLQVHVSGYLETAHSTRTAMRTELSALRGGQQAHAMQPS